MEEYGMVYRKNKTMFVIGKHSAGEAFWSNEEVRRQIEDIAEARPHCFTNEAAADIFMLGYIHGKRAERARRKRRYAGMNEEQQFYKNHISEMLATIRNVEWLRKIYSFIKVFADDKEGAA